MMYDGYYGKMTGQSPVPQSATGMPINQFMQAGINPYSIHREITRVKGKYGVDNYVIGPNSSELLLDETEPVVWLVQTDALGYKTSTPFSISPYTPKEEVTMDDILSRLKQLEQKMGTTNISESEGVSTNGKSNTSKTKSKSTDVASASDV